MGVPGKPCASVIDMRAPDGSNGQMNRPLPANAHYVRPELGSTSFADGALDSLLASLGFATPVAELV